MASFHDSIEQSQLIRPNVELHRLVMMSMRHCDYTGSVPSEVSVCVVSVPYNHLLGVVCREELYDYAKKNVCAACSRMNIFPINSDTQSKMGFSEVFSVKRGSGEIQNGWQLQISVATPEIDIPVNNCEHDVLIPVHNAELCLNKIVPLKDLCEINKVDYATARSVLEKDLYEWFDESQL